METTIEHLIEMAHDDHNAALIAARHLDGWRAGWERIDGAGNKYRTHYNVNRPEEPEVHLAVWSHEYCLRIIELHRPGFSLAAFDACI